MTASSIGMKVPVQAVAMLLALASFAGTPRAQTTPPPDAPSATVPAAGQPMHRLRARFDAANMSHDGHLTLAEAQADGWSMVARNFDAIDGDHKGYVTLSDIRSFAKARHAQRAASASQQP